MRLGVPGAVARAAGLSAVLTALTLAACDRGDEPAQAPAVATSLAAAASAPAPEARPSLDQALRVSAAEFAAGRGAEDLIAARREGVYSMQNGCGITYPEDVVPVADPDRGIDDTAADSVYRLIDEAVLRHDVTALGYPEEVVESALQMLARDQQAYDRMTDEEKLAFQESGRADPAWQAAAAEDPERFQDGFAPYRRFLSRLAAYRRTNAPSLPLITPPYECGAGELAVRVDLQPDGRAYFTSMFRFRACGLSAPDAYDRRRCPYWREVPEGQTVWMAGDYAYALEWADGRRRRGVLPIEYGDGADTGDEARVVVLRPER